MLLVAVTGAARPLGLSDLAIGYPRTYRLKVENIETKLLPHDQPQQPEGDVAFAIKNDQGTALVPYLIR